jgi:hypothetical protein
MPDLPLHIDRGVDHLSGTCDGCLVVAVFVPVVVV